MFLPFYILKLYTSNLSYLTNTLSLGLHQQICTHAKLNTKMLLLVLYLNFLYKGWNLHWDFQYGKKAENCSFRKPHSLEINLYCIL